MVNSIASVLTGTPCFGSFIIVEFPPANNTYSSSGWQGIYILNHPNSDKIGMCYWLEKYDYYIEGTHMTVNTNKLYPFILSSAKYFKNLKKISLFTYWNEVILKNQLAQQSKKNDIKKCSLGTKI
jgi:hypothetical protein